MVRIAFKTGISIIKIRTFPIILIKYYCFHNYIFIQVEFFDNLPEKTNYVIIDIYADSILDNTSNIFHILISKSNLNILSKIKGIRRLHGSIRVSQKKNGVFCAKSAKYAPN